LIEAAGPVDAAVFDRFAGVVLRGNREVEQLVWAPVAVDPSGVPYRSVAQLSPADFLPGYILPAASGDLLGHDFSSLPGYATCLGKAVASTVHRDRLCVVPVKGGVDILVILTVERSGTLSDTGGLWGVIAGRIHLRLATGHDGEAVEIFDLGVPGGMKLLHPGEHADVTADTVAAAGGVYRDLHLGSETWRLADFPAVRTVPPVSRESLFVLAGCLAMTTNLAGYIMLIQRRRQRIEAKVNDRTQKLETALSGLRLSEQRLQDYAATASDWSWETGANLRFTRVAAQAREHKIEPSGLIGLDRLTDDDAEDEAAQRRQILNRHLMFRDLRYDYAVDRDLLTLSLSGLPIFAPDGTFLGYRGSARDITLQLQVEARQRLARWAAEQANRAKSNFLATMSHEIRTPMNGVLGMVQLLSDTALDHEQRRMCDIIYRSGNSLQQILNDILDYSKLEAGKITLELIGSSLIDVVSSVVALMCGTAEAKGLRIEVEAAADALPPVLVDPTRFRQVLLNLISNAIKFSEQGIVSIRLRGEAAGAGLLAVTLEVADQGIGIGVDVQRRLFARFSQADDSTTRRFGGTGLGLAITRELVTLMGGTIGVQSIAGKGSTFSVQMTLPIAEAIHGPIAPPRWTAQMADAQTLDILVAEDDVINQEVICGLLRGHRLTVVGDGRSAVEAAQVGRFDVLLMDIMMPVMDGMKAAAAIRALATPEATLPIIALTANSMSGDQERYLSGGMNAYVSKPIDRRHLFEVIERVTGMHVWRPLAAEPVAPRAPEATPSAAREMDDFIASLEL
jgi:signal transduction histidine kinase/CheY-like chemotaxis protein